MPLRHGAGDARVLASTRTHVLTPIALGGALTASFSVLAVECWLRRAPGIDLARVGQVVGCIGMVGVAILAMRHVQQGLTARLIEHYVAGTKRRGLVISHALIIAACLWSLLAHTNLFDLGSYDWLAAPPRDMKRADAYRILASNLFALWLLSLISHTWHRLWQRLAELSRRSNIPERRYQANASASPPRLIQLTDLHIRLETENLVENPLLEVDPYRVLEEAIGHLREVDPQRRCPLLLTGDLTDRGHPDEWKRLAELLDRLQGWPLAIVPGNHDLNIETFPVPNGRFALAKRTLRTMGWMDALDSAGYAYRALLFMRFLADYQSRDAMVWQHPAWHGLDEVLDRRLPELAQLEQVLLGQGGWAVRSKRGAAVSAVLRIWRSLYPMLLWQNEEYVVVGVNSVAPTSGLVNAYGSIDFGQLQRLRELAPSLQGRRLVLALHHHLGRPDKLEEKASTAPDLTEPGLIISNASDLLRVLGDCYPNALVVHGHRHIRSELTWDLRGSEGIVSLGAPSTTLGDSARKIPGPLLVAIDPGQRSSMCVSSAQLRELLTASPTSLPPGEPANDQGAVSVQALPSAG